jgi:hypothetical protein
MNEPDPEEPDEWEPEDDDSDLRRRTFLERHDWIPWIAAAVLVGGSAGLLQGYLNWP